MTLQRHHWWTQEVQLLGPQLIFSQLIISVLSQQEGGEVGKKPAKQTYKSEICEHVKVKPQMSPISESYNEILGRQAQTSLWEPTIPCEPSALMAVTCPRQRDWSPECLLFPSSFSQVPELTNPHAIYFLVHGHLCPWAGSGHWLQTTLTK